MWDLSLSQASFHSLSQVTLNCRWQGWKVCHCMVQRRKGDGGGKAFFFSLTKFTILYFFPQWHQGLVILRQNRLKKKKN